MRLAIYAGTFDPITMGHLSVIERGAKLFDRLWVLVAINPSKEPLFTAAERVQMLEKRLKKVDADLLKLETPAGKK